jgi:hypothetical protein
MGERCVLRVLSIEVLPRSSFVVSGSWWSHRDGTCRRGNRGGRGSSLTIRSEAVEVAAGELVVADGVDTAVTLG